MPCQRFPFVRLSFLLSSCVGEQFCMPGEPRYRPHVSAGRAEARRRVRQRLTAECFRSSDCSSRRGRLLRCTTRALSVSRSPRNSPDDQHRAVLQPTPLLPTCSSASTCSPIHLSRAEPSSISWFGARPSFPRRSLPLSLFKHGFEIGLQEEVLFLLHSEEELDSQASEVGL